MKTEIKNKRFILFVVRAAVLAIFTITLIVGTNYLIDASQVITSKGYTKMAELALGGNIVATAENYNERVYQMAIIGEMAEIPATIVVGSSRGMYLGEEITGYEHLYNDCVSGACLEDYYALIGLYYQKFSELPSRIIIETSPWVFYEHDPEVRWSENYSYMSACKNFYRIVNGYELVHNINRENPYISIPYFQYNISMLRKMGIKVFEDEAAHVSADPAESADYPDGTIRYRAELENANDKRLQRVQRKKGAVTYKSVDNMTEMSVIKIQEYENLLNFLTENSVEIIIYMQPFSITQCQYIYDENMNPVFSDVEEYLDNIGTRYDIRIVGGYDAREFDISDELFIDFMHLDKTGVKIVWENSGSEPL